MSYIILGVMALVLVILAAQFLRRDPDQVGQLPLGTDDAVGKYSNLVPKGVSLKEAMHTGPFWQLCAISVCSFFSVGTFLIHIVAHATDLGVSAIGAANIYAVAGISGIFGRIIVGMFIDRISTKPGLVITSILLSISLFLLAGSEEATMLYVSGVILGFAYGGLISLQSPLVAELFGLSSHGVIFGVICFGGTVGLAVGSLMAGALFDTMGNYGLAFSACAAASIFSLILAVLLKPLSIVGIKNDMG